LIGEPSRAKMRIWKRRTDITEDLALVDVGVVNGRVRNRSVPGGGAMVGIVTVTRLRALAPRTEGACLLRFCFRGTAAGLALSLSGSVSVFLDQYDHYTYIY
jgi:hypothetical protein